MRMSQIITRFQTNNRSLNSALVETESSNKMKMIQRWRLINKSADSFQPHQNQVFVRIFFSPRRKLVLREVSECSMSFRVSLATHNSNETYAHPMNRICPHKTIIQIDTMTPFLRMNHSRFTEMKIHPNVWFAVFKCGEASKSCEFISNLICRMTAFERIPHSVPSVSAWGAHGSGTYYGRVCIHDTINATWLTADKIACCLINTRRALKNSIKRVVYYYERLSLGDNV